MDDATTRLDQLKSIARQFAEDRDWEQYHDPKELAIGVITEASELLEHFRFKNSSQMEKLLKDPIKREEIGEELADVLYFIVRFSQKYDIDLSQAFEKKMDKNNKKYPVEKTKGKNVKYDEL